MNNFNYLNMANANFFGWLGALLSIGFFASPTYKYYNLIKSKIDYKEINIFVILGNYISSFIWLIYEYETQIKQIKVCYSLGALISFIFLWIYLSYMGKEKTVLPLIYTTLLTSLTFGAFIFFELILNDKKVLKALSCIFCSLIYVSPTPLFIKAFNSKNYNIVQIYRVIFSTIIYGIWTIFGFLKSNKIIIIPNLLGLTLTLPQIILYRIYKNDNPLTEEINNISKSTIGTMKKVVDQTVELSTYPNNNNINDEPLVNKDINNEDNEIDKETNNNINLDKKINDSEEIDNDNEKLI